MRIHVAALGLALLFAGAAPAAVSSEGRNPPGGAGQPAAPIVVDCAHPALPGLRQVAELTERNNAGQVHALRARLMLEAGRACRRAGVGQVQLVREMPARAQDGPRIADAAR